MKNKRLAALLVAFAMCLTSLSTFAYDAYTENGAIYMTPVTLADGSELTEVSAGESITLTAQVKAGKDAAEGQTAQMLAVAYKDGIVKSAVPGEKITVTDVKQPLTAALTVPSDADALKVFVLDGRDTRRPIAEAGVVGEDSVKVTGISIDGEMIEEFSPDVYEYDIALNAAYMTYPEITIHTSDILAKTEIVDADPFPAESASVTARVTKNGEVAASYTINFTQAAPAVTNIKCLTSDGYVDISDDIVTLAEPQNFPGKISREEMYTASLSDINAKTITPSDDLPTDYIEPRNNRADMTLYNMSPEILGGTMIQMPYGEGVSTVAGTPDVLTFDINRSATIYVYAKNTAGQSALAQYGFSVASGSPSYYYNNLPEGTSGDSSVGDVMAFYFTISSSRQEASRARVKAWVKKDVIVDSSVGKASVSIPATGEQFFVATVKFHEAPLALNPKVTTESGTANTTVLRSVFEPVMTSDTYTADDYFEKALYYPNVFSDRVAKGAGITKFEDDIIGAEAILLPYTDDVTLLEFELNHSAEVYLVSANGGLPTSQPGSAWIGAAAPVAKELVTQYANDETLYDITESNTTVKQEYRVIPGETVKVQIDNLPTGRVFVFVKRAELE